MTNNLRRSFFAPTFREIKDTSLALSSTNRIYLSSYLSFHDKSLKIALICCLFSWNIFLEWFSLLEAKSKYTKVERKRKNETKIIDCNYRQVFDIKNYFGRHFFCFNLSTSKDEMFNTPEWEILLQPLSIHFDACLALCSFLPPFRCINNFLLMFYSEMWKIFY